MARSSILIYSVFLLFVVVVAINGKCVPGDPDCAKQGAANSYPLFVTGIEGLVKTSDPLSLAVIPGNLPGIKYKLQNAKFHGLKTCSVTKLEIRKANSTFKYHLECPIIGLNAEYKMIGNIADFFVEGEGIVTVSCKDYVLMFDGKFEKIKGKNGKDHAQIKSYFLDGFPRGSEVFEFSNLYYGDTEKSDVFHKFINDNYRSIDKQLRAPVINPFMDLFINNLNDFLKVVPIEEIFPGLV